MYVLKSDHLRYGWAIFAKHLKYAPLRLVRMHTAY
uniref:Uncharacterized protein n=1 Tax=Arundo donax TaxID=35708 RepID=A0A0A8Y5J8_ARUDO